MNFTKCRKFCATCHINQACSNVYTVGPPCDPFFKELKFLDFCKKLRDENGFKAWSEDQNNAYITCLTTLEEKFKTLFIKE